MSLWGPHSSPLLKFFFRFSLYFIIFYYSQPPFTVYIYAHVLRPISYFPLAGTVYALLLRVNADDMGWFFLLSFAQLPLLYRFIFQSAPSSHNNNLLAKEITGLTHLATKLFVISKMPQLFSSLIISHDLPFPFSFFFWPRWFA